ncbi:MAG: hypothetical protein IPP40_04625 [bacterium]|nr:hypothetical protein [bacterium]
MGITQTEFAVLPKPVVRRSSDNLDESSNVTISTQAQLPLSIGTEFTVSLELTGNGENSVKAVEVKLGYDHSMLEYVGSNSGDIRSTENNLHKIRRDWHGRECRCRWWLRAVVDRLLKAIQHSQKLHSV